MRWGVTALTAAGLWLVSACLLAASAAPPPVSAFARTAPMESLSLSPSGQLIAWIANNETQPVIQVLDVAKGTQVKRVDVPSGLDVRGIDWADDEILLLHADVVRTPEGVDIAPRLRTVAMEVNTDKSRVLLHMGEYKRFPSPAHLLAAHTNKPHTVLFSSRSMPVSWEAYRPGRELPPRNATDRDWGDHLYEVDTLTGEGFVLHWGTNSTLHWALDAQGQVVARSEWNSKRDLFQLLRRQGDRWTPFYRLRTGKAPELIGLTGDGSAALVLGQLHRENVSIWRVPLDGSSPQLAIGDTSGDITRLVRDPYSRQVLGAWTGGLVPEVRWIDEQAEKRAKSLQKTFGGKHATLIGRSADGTRALVSVGAHAAPVTHYLVDFKRGTADIVSEQYPELVDVSLGEVRALTFNARDGYKVPAYLTLPPGSEPKKLPLVVLPHAWPEGRNETAFDPIAQFLATRGYAVLQPQFRGSGGFGDAHLKAGYRQWGGLMQDDVTDSVRAMIEQGIVDSRRVCIAGIGYGGYAALAGVAFTPELYACAISVNGVADLPELIDQLRRFFDKVDLSMTEIEEQIGSKRHPDLAAKSPARAASQVKAPILLLHAVGDPWVPVEQSRSMMKALGGQAPHELIELPGEDHAVEDSATRIRVLTEMERFLTKHLPVAGQGGN